MNYYPFHIGDYLSATRHLSWEEDAAFRRLLDTYYTTEKPLPADMRAVCRLVLATTDSQREAVQIVLKEFFVLTDAGWVNQRADQEIDAMREKQQKQRDRANKRWHKPEAEHANAPAMPRHEEVDATALKTDANAMPPTPTPTPTPIINTGVQGGKPPKPPAFAVPDWIPAKQWQDFVDMRRAKGKRAPFTVAAAKGIVEDLDRMRQDGVVIEDVLNTSVKNGWSGVFAPKDAPRNNAVAGAI